MNQVATTNGGAVSLMGSDPFTKAGEAMGAPSGSFLKFDGNDGVWKHGQENDELQDGTQLAVNMMEFARGYICWNDGEVMEKILVPVASGQTPPQVHELTDHGPYKRERDGWSEQSAIKFRSLEDGTEFTYQTSSKSGVMALGRLAVTYGKNYAQKIDDDGDNLVPIVEVGASSFSPKNDPGITKYAPTMKIVDWISHAELNQMFDPQQPELEDDFDEDEVDTTAKAEAPSRGRRGRTF